LKLSTAQIGKCGELLVQYHLLLLGIESASMSTDSGVDLVVYSSSRKHPATIQVKTNLKPKPGGGKGKAAIDWWLPEDSPAELVAFVNLRISSHLAYDPRRGSEVRPAAFWGKASPLYVYRSGSLT
jgi:hypothetical protein